MFIHWCSWIMSPTGSSSVACDQRGDPSVVICMDEFGPLNLLPRLGKQWAPWIVKAEEPTVPRRRHRRSTCTRTRVSATSWQLLATAAYGNRVQ